MKSNSFLCDADGCLECKESDSNHWFLVTVGKSIIIQRWEDAKPEDIDQADFHLCGLAHLLSKISWLLSVTTTTLEGKSC